MSSITPVKCPKNVEDIFIVSPHTLEVYSKRKTIRCNISGPLKPVTRLIVHILVPDDASRFSINLHQDEKNILFHFDPRFEYGSCVSITACNTMKNGEFGKEERFGGDENPFPFVRGGDYTVAFECEGNEFVAFVNDSPYIRYKCPETFSLQDITYLEVVGAHVGKVKAVKLLEYVP